MRDLPRAASPTTGLLVLLTGGLGLVTVAVVTGVADRYVDQPVRSRVSSREWPLPDRWLDVVVRAGDADVAVAGATGAVVLSLLLGRPVSRAARLVAGCAVAALVVRLLKHSIDRTGSYTMPGELGPGQGAYPSGHVISVFVVSGLAFWAVSSGSNPSARLQALLVAAGAATVESAALLLQQQHWLTDVLAGWLLGLLLLLLSTAPLRRYRPGVTSLTSAAPRPLQPSRNHRKDFP